MKCSTSYRRRAFHVKRGRDTCFSLIYLPEDRCEPVPGHGPIEIGSCNWGFGTPVVSDSWFSDDSH